MRIFKNKEEVLKLNKEQNQKLAFYGEAVIDLKDFKHPGPQDLIDNNIGKDIQSDFIDQNHSPYAHDLVKKLTIGNLATDDNFYQPEFATELSKSRELIHAQVDKKLDLSKPILPQIKNFTKDEFLALIERPRYINGTDNIQIHETYWKDFTSKNPIILNIILLPTFSFYLLYNSIEMNFMDLTNRFILTAGIFYLLIILFGWSFVEYYVHRFVLHPENQDDFPKDPSPEMLMTIFSRHLMHHTFINQKHRIAQNVWNVIFKVLLVDFIFGFILPLYILRIFLSAFVLGNVLYDMLHYYYHFGGEPPFKFLADLKSHHMRHHYRNSKYEYGVTSYFWDWIYGTDIKKTEKVN